MVIFLTLSCSAIRSRGFIMKKFDIQTKAPEGYEVIDFRAPEEGDITTSYDGTKVIHWKHWPGIQVRLILKEIETT